VTIVDGLEELGALVEVIRVHSDGSKERLALH
jgi:hypothetical protein